MFISRLITLYVARKLKRIAKLINQPMQYKLTRLLKDRLGDQRGGSEWEPIKNLLEGD
jgi:hypothetical protein